MYTHMDMHCVPLSGLLNVNGHLLRSRNTDVAVPSPRVCPNGSSAKTVLRHSMNVCTTCLWMSLWNSSSNWHGQIDGILPEAWHFSNFWGYQGCAWDKAKYFRKNRLCACKKRDRHTQKNNENIKHKIARTGMCCVMPVVPKSLQIGRPSVTNQQVNQLTSQPGNQLTRKNSWSCKQVTRELQPVDEVTG